MKKTDNSFFEEKVILRQDVLDILDKKEISVLELYAGKSLMWKQLKKNNKDKTINLLSIEKERNKNKYALCGDNLKFIDSINLKRFDIIDIDAYGIPFEQIKKVINNGFEGYVIVTFIQTMQGRLPKNLVKSVGLSKEMYNKIPSVFSKNALVYLNNFLYICGIKKIRGYFINRKRYFYFKSNNNN